jgi:hypothetical protein
MKLDLSLWECILNGDLSPIKINKFSDEKLSTVVSLRKNEALNTERVIDSVNKALSEQAFFLKLLLCNKDCGSGYSAVLDHYKFILPYHKSSHAEISFDEFEDFFIVPSNTLSYKVVFYYFLISCEIELIQKEINESIKDISVGIEEKKEAINNILISLSAIINLLYLECDNLYDEDHEDFYKLPPSKKKTIERINFMIFHYCASKLYSVTENIINSFGPLIDDKFLKIKYAHKHYFINQKNDEFAKICMMEQSEIIKKQIEGILEKNLSIKKIEELFKKISKFLFTPISFFSERFYECSGFIKINANHIIYLENVYLLAKMNMKNNFKNYFDGKYSDYSEEIYLNAKAIIEVLLNENNLVNKKIELLKAEFEYLDELNYLSKEYICFIDEKFTDDENRISIQKSAPRRLGRWLKSEINFYEKNITKDFTKIMDGEIKKLETNLSVPQLALLFRILKEINIIQNENITEMCKTIAGTYATLKKSEISAGSLKNHFDTPEEKALDFWLAKVPSLGNKIRDLKEKYSK